MAQCISTAASNWRHHNCQRPPRSWERYSNRRWSQRSWRPLTSTIVVDDLNVVLMTSAVIDNCDVVNGRLLLKCTVPRTTWILYFLCLVSYKINFFEFYNIFNFVFFPFYFRWSMAQCISTAASNRRHHNCRRPPRSWGRYSNRWWSWRSRRPGWRPWWWRRPRWGRPRGPGFEVTPGRPETQSQPPITITEQRSIQSKSETFQIQVIFVIFFYCDF